MQYVKAPNAGNVIRYEGTDFDDPNWNAEEVPESEYDGDVNALPNYDDVGQPWAPVTPPVLTPEEKVAKMLENHEITLDELKQVLGA